MRCGVVHGIAVHGTADYAVCVGVLSAVDDVLDLADSAVAEVFIICEYTRVDAVLAQQIKDVGMVPCVLDELGVMDVLFVYIAGHHQRQRYQRIGTSGECVFVFREAREGLLDLRVLLLVVIIIRCVHRA